MGSWWILTLDIVPSALASPPSSRPSGDNSVASASRRTALAVLACAVLFPGVTPAAEPHERGKARHIEPRATREPADTRFLAGPKKGAALDIALDYLRAHAPGLGLTVADLEDVSVTSQYVSEHSGTTHIYLRQRHKGIEVHGADISINVARDGSVVNMGGAFVPNLRTAIRGQAADLQAAESAESAALQLGMRLKRPIVPMAEKGGPAKSTTLSDGGVSRKPIPARLVYERTESGEVALAWLVEIDEAGGDHWWAVTVDAETGEVLEKSDYAVHDRWAPEAAVSGSPVVGTAAATAPDTLSSKPSPPSYTGVPNTGMYRVIGWPKGDPSDGDRVLVVDPAHPTGSPLGWHDVNGVAGADATTTTGNNVDAYTDVNNNNNGNPPDVRADGGAGLDFDFPLDLSASPGAYRPAAVTNLFYWNNVMHDLSYLYGFTEPAGNFQTNNYGRGPTAFPLGANDRVLAEAQDGGGMNNSGFTTPPDGSSGRMQMFLWVPPGAYEVQVSSGPLAGTSHAAVRANFGAMLADSSLTRPHAPVVATTPSNGCTALTGFPAGSIAFVESGGGPACTNVVKAQNAQAAGAIGIIVNSGVPDGPTFVTLTGVAPVDAAGQSTLTIPVLGLSTTTAAQLSAQLPFDAKMAFLGTPAPLRDGALDATIIAHEYTHGISNRLTGGRTNVSCLNNNEQMGEGWSDWVAMAFTHDPERPLSRTRGLGAYVGFTGVDGPGMRPTPYSTDMTINPSTYATIKTAGAPFGVGYVWASQLWEVYWNLIDKHGFNPDVYQPWSTGGNNLAIQLVFDGMKLQPCSPGFETGRNAILLADQLLTGGENQCAIWKGFAKRGLGYGASQGSANNVNDGVESFDLPPLCQAGLTISPAVLEATQECGTTTSRSLAIHNTSAVDGTDLDWAITAAGSGAACTAATAPSWVSTTPPAGLTAPGADSTVAVSFDSTTLDVGAHAAKLCVGSNAADPPMEVPLSVTVFDVTPPRVTAPAAVSVSASPSFCGAVVDDATLGSATAGDNCAAGAAIARRGMPAGNVFSVGVTTIEYAATDAVGLQAAATQGVSVADTTPALISGASASPSVLWSPNHKFVDVVVGYDTTDNCGAVTTSLSVSSNEPVNGKKGPDWQVVDAHHVKLRAERSGEGRGRIYTITITAVDGHGNSSSRSVPVLVPHDSAGGDPRIPFGIATPRSARPPRQN